MLFSVVDCLDYMYLKYNSVYDQDDYPFSQENYIDGRYTMIWIIQQFTVF